MQFAGGAPYINPDDWGVVTDNGGGIATMSRRLGASSATTAGSGTMILSCFRAPQDLLATQIATTNSTAATATPSDCYMVVYSYDVVADTLTLIGTTANDTSLWSVANARNVANLLAPVQLRQGNWYGAGYLAVSGVAMMAIQGAGANTGSGRVIIEQPRLAIGVTAAAPPATIIPANINRTNADPFVELLAA
jgi:hypothetical protein